jgi:hypothetical protein
MIAEVLQTTSTKWSKLTKAVVKHIKTIHTMRTQNGIATKENMTLPEGTFDKLKL